MVSRLITEHGLDINGIPGTGQDGRVTRRDVAYLERRAAAPVPEHAQLPLAAETGDDVMAELEPASLMRSRIAEHMLASQRAAPHVTTIWEVDFSAVMAHRAAHRAEAERAAGLRLTLLAYVVCAVAGALREHPDANSHWRTTAEGRPTLRGCAP